MLASAQAAAARHGGPVALLVLVNLLFSGYAVLASSAFKSGTSPVVFALLRDLIACALFLAALARARPARLLPRAEHAGAFIALAISGVWGSQLFSALCISNLSAPIYSLLKPAVPVVTLVLAAAAGVAPFDLRTRPTRLTVAGVLLAIGGGAAIVAASFADRESKNALLGAGYVTVYMLCSGSYPIVQKAMLRSPDMDYDPLFLVAWAYLLGTTMIFACVIVVASFMASSIIAECPPPLIKLSAFLFAWLSGCSAVSPFAPKRPRVRTPSRMRFPVWRSLRRRGRGSEWFRWGTVFMCSCQISCGKWRRRLEFKGMCRWDCLPLARRA